MQSSADLIILLSQGEVIDVWHIVHVWDLIAAAAYCCCWAFLLLCCPAGHMQGQVSFLEMDESSQRHKGLVLPRKWHVTCCGLA